MGTRKQSAKGRKAAVDDYPGEHQSQTQFGRSRKADGESGDYRDKNDPRQDFENPRGWRRGVQFADPGSRIVLRFKRACRACQVSGAEDCKYPASRMVGV